MNPVDLGGSDYIQYIERIIFWINTGIYKKKIIKSYSGSKKRNYVCVCYIRWGSGVQALGADGGSLDPKNRHTHTPVTFDEQKVKTQWRRRRYNMHLYTFYNSSPHIEKREHTRQPCCLFRHPTAKINL